MKFSAFKVEINIVSSSYNVHVIVFLHFPKIKVRHKVFFGSQNITINS